MASDQITLPQSNRTAGSAEQLEAARIKAELYLRAWNVPDNWRDEILRDALNSAEAVMAEQGSAEPVATLIKESERLLAQRLNELLSGGVGASAELSPETRLSLICSDLPRKWHDTSPEELRRAYDQGCGDLELAKHCQRCKETHLETMETSLTRLPSFRILAGWLVLIVLIILAFKLTH